MGVDPWMGNESRCETDEEGYLSGSCWGGGHLHRTKLASRYDGRLSALHARLLAMPAFQHYRKSLLPGFRRTKMARPPYQPPVNWPSNAERTMTTLKFGRQLRSYMSLPTFLVAARQKQPRVYSSRQLQRMTDEEVVAVAIRGGRTIVTLKDAQELAAKSKDLREWFQLLAVYEREGEPEDSMENMLEASARRRDARLLRSRRE
jgi:hypothetical protein